jgi:glycosyltransferase involved in cell wall biosynthesis
VRVVVITNRFGDVGTHPQLTRLALHLREVGHDVRAISLAPPGTIPEMFARSGIRTETIDARRRGSSLPTAWRLSTLFQRLRPDVAVAFLYEAIMPTRFAGLIARVPVISSIRNEYFGPRRREVILRVTERLSAVTVVNSDRVAASLVNRGIASPRHLVVIHNGIDVSRFAPSAERRRRTRASLGVDDGEFVWLAVGRLTEQKGYAFLLRAFSAVIEAVPSARLFIVGRGALREELERTVRISGVHRKISFLGFRSDIVDLLIAADALVLASRYEGMPNVVMEALSTGRPVVATDVGAVPDLITDGLNGYLAPPSDPDALAAAMTKVLLSSPERLAAMGQRGRERVQEICDLSTVMGQWQKLIEETPSHPVR